MSNIKDVEDLRVFQTSMKLLPELYDVAYKIPQQAAFFYETAMTESDEVAVHLKKAIILSHRFPRIPKKKCEELVEKYKALSKQLNRLTKTWQEFS